MNKLKSNRKFSFDGRRAAVQKLREGYGFTQAELAQAAQVSQPKLSQFETGEQDLGEAAFMRVEGALVDAIAARKLELATAERFLPLSSMLHVGPRKRQTSMEQIEAEIKDGLLTGVRT